MHLIYHRKLAHTRERERDRASFPCLVFIVLQAISQKSICALPTALAIKKNSCQSINSLLQCVTIVAWKHTYSLSQYGR
ncbi:hypothetical protein BDW22DRAFT_16090 [Trametopsis cervina]|nr:hypothetical protein BDW22DRAFT_16090 [Trametopsis cervina]